MSGPERDGPADGPVLDAEHPDVREFFGPAYAGVLAFHDMLVAEGELRGLIGPREVDRLWERHLVNSGAVARLLPERGTVVDIGSGGGFPGIVLAVMRPQLRVMLVESMLRRTAWLSDVVGALSLTNVEVVRARAEELGAVGADAVTARAVAPLDRLAGWAMPLLRAGGELLAMKGVRAGEELAEARAVIDAWGGGARGVVEVPTLPGSDPAIVVRVVRERLVTPQRGRRRR